MKKKVIIFCDYFGNGGIERVAQYIKNNINKDKYIVEILSTIYDSQIYNEEVIQITNAKNRNPIYRFIKTITNIRKFTADADIVHINMHSPIGLFYAFLLKKRVNKIIVHAHNSNFDRDFLKIKLLISNIFKFLFNSSQYVYIACSKQASQFCFGEKVKSKILHNELDIERYIFNEKKRKETRLKYNIKDNEIVVGNIGRLSKQKNQGFLIDIFAEFRNFYPNAKLILIGEGKEEKNIRKSIVKKNIEKSVIMINNVKDIENMYQTFDFYVAPSRFEGYGNTIYEAILSSLLCLVSENVCKNFNNKNLISINLNKPALYWATKMKENVGYNRSKIDVSNNNHYIKNIEKLYK